MQCPICDYPNAQPHYRMKDRFFAVSSEEFELYRCSSCGLLFQQEEEIRECLADFYPPGYWWQASGRLSSLEAVYREWIVRLDQLGFVTSLLSESRGERLLDIGCGNGTFVQLAHGVGLDAYGLEQSQEAVEVAEQQVPGRIFHGIEQDLVERKEQFDIITLFHCLEHLTSPFLYLKNLQKLLRGPGKLVVQVPNVHSLQAKLFGSRWYGLDCPRHVYNYSTTSLIHLLERAGFRIHRVRHFSLRDNAAALVSSLFPILDPMSQRVKLLREKGKKHSLGLSIREVLYLPLFVLAQPLALLEAILGRGATVTVFATMD